MRVSISYRNKERHGNAAERRKDRKTTTTTTMTGTTVMRIQVVRTHSIRSRLPSASLSRPRSFFLPFNLIPRFSTVRSSLHSFYSVPYRSAIPAAPRLFSISSSSSSSSVSSATAAVSSSSPSSPSSSFLSSSRSFYLQARCIPEPREWKDLVKVSRSLAYMRDLAPSACRVPQ